MFDPIENVLLIQTTPPSWRAFAGISLLTDLRSLTCWTGIWFRFTSGAIVGVCCWTPVKPKLNFWVGLGLLSLHMVNWSCTCWVSIGACPNLGVLFDSKLIFEAHLRNIVSCVFQRLGILMLVRSVIDDTSVLLRCYFGFVLPVFEYCSPVWASASESHL